MFKLKNYEKEENVFNLGWDSSIGFSALPDFA